MLTHPSPQTTLERPRRVAALFNTELTADGRLVLTFPGEVSKGEFVADMPKYIGVAHLPFSCMWPCRTLFAHMGGIPVEGVLATAAGLNVRAQGTPQISVQRRWRTGETMRFTAESLIDVHMPGELGTETQVRIRNDVKLEVIEAMPDQSATLALTFERVRVEETEDGAHRETDTLSDTGEKLEANPWAAIVGKRIEATVAAETGKVSLPRWDAFVSEVAGSNPAKRMVINGLIKPRQIMEMLESLKPRKKWTGPATAGSVWQEQFDPGIPLSDIQLDGKVIVVSAKPNIIAMQSEYSLPKDIAPEKLVAEQLEFKMVGAKYQKVDCLAHTLFDPVRAVSEQHSATVHMHLEGRLNSAPLHIESTQRFNLWLLDHVIKNP